jgi:peptidoglycan LD-endopeptidase LytH
VAVVVLAALVTSVAFVAGSSRGRTDRTLPIGDPPDRAPLVHSPPVSTSPPAYAPDLPEPLPDERPESDAPLPDGVPFPAEQDPSAGPTLCVPVLGIAPEDLTDTFEEVRGSGVRHEALDIVAPKGTPVVAADDGTIRKLFTSKKGGLTIYQYDPTEEYCYYYAHLDRYAEGVEEGKQVRSGEVIGYVGATGNASEDTPHLHFAVTRLDAEKRWWEGTPINPYRCIRNPVKEMGK